jgi:phosphatidylglycerol:prolipoprotein diacylglycerol transferase
MIPFVVLPSWKIGPIDIEAPNLLFAGGILVTYLLIVFRARTTGLDPKLASDLCVWMLLAGVAGTVLFKYAYQAGEGAPVARTSFGAIGGGLAGGAAFFTRKRMPARDRWFYLDLVASRVPMGFACGRAGCSLAHDHVGVPSSSWLAVAYPDGPRFDLGVLEFLYLIPMCCLFVGLGRTKRPVPYLGLGLILYGIFRFALARLDANPTLWFGVTVDQYAAIAALLLGIWALLHDRAWGDRNSARTAPVLRVAARSSMKNIHDC